ncbi:unnamed protein product [Clonostachys solani]|uniref:Uncharacterized protein n=1 Tax=Clonostachys solani TaxID=160281 RepID=A0A9P0EKM9_9HYPO|nr:unnamed protein product [Clonostachys solani]
MGSFDFKQPKLESSETEAVSEFVRNHREIKEKQRESSEKMLKKLNEEWHKGHISSGNMQEYRDEIERLEREISTLTTDIIVLHTSYYEICGRIIDWAIWGKNEDTHWSYLDMLIRLYKTPEGARCTLFTKRTQEARNRFRTDVLKAYDAFNDDGEVWCAISKRHYWAKNIKAAYIVRYNVGEATAAHLFGPTDSKDGHLMGAKNAFPMHEYYEKLFDEGGLVIVPDAEAGPNCWKTQWLYGEHEKRPGGGEGLPTGTGLQNLKLEFKNDFRPAARYLYFAYCMSILRRQRHDIPGWWKDLLNAETNSIWASPGDYMRTSTLRKLARRVGHLTEDEALAFSGESAADIAGDNENQLADSVHSDIAAQASMKSPIPSHRKNDSDDLEIPTDEEDEDEGGDECNYYIDDDNDGTV